jgi:hypothetical protein
VVLLAALVLLLLLGVGAAALAVLRGRQEGGSSVAGAKGVPEIKGSGVQVSANPQAPAGPGAVSAATPPPIIGAPVTGNARPGSDTAPSMIMAPGAAAPARPSVISGPSRLPTPGPSPIESIAQPRPPGPSPVASVPQPRAPGAPMVQNPSPTPPAPPDNRDFDQYLRWLQRVENFRAALRAQGETQSFSLINDFYSTMMMLSDPTADDGRVQAQFNANLNNKLRAVVNDIRLTWRNINRTKPPVPLDCSVVDQFYMHAVVAEGEATTALLEALAQKDIGRIKAIGRMTTGQIDRDLGQANRALKKAFEGRGLNQIYEIETGKGSSMLGGLLGM